MNTYLWTPPPVFSLPVKGRNEEFPIRRLFFVGRNYHAHAAEMGRPVDKTVDRPFYFTKAPQALLRSGSQLAYPPETKNFHYEMEMVVAIGREGFRISTQDASSYIYGYACGLDMTRRDLQLVARDQGKPWDLGKDVDESAVCSPIVPMPNHIINSGTISLSVNGQMKQSSNVNRLIWDVSEIISDLSLFYRLAPGDLIYTGTPEGVGPVVPGDILKGKIEGIGEIDLTIGPPNP